MMQGVYRADERHRERGGKVKKARNQKREREL